MLERKHTVQKEIKKHNTINISELITYIKIGQILNFINFETLSLSLSSSFYLSSSNIFNFYLSNLIKS